MTSRTASHGWIFPLKAILTPAITMTINASPANMPRPKGHHLTTRGCRKAVKGGLNEGLEIPYFLRGEICGDIRVNLNLHRRGLLDSSAVERRDSEKQPLAHRIYAGRNPCLLRVKRNLRFALGLHETGQFFAPRYLLVRTLSRSPGPPDKPSAAPSQR